MNEEMIKIVASQLNKTVAQVNVVLEMLAAGNTVPFIARYRKEATGALNEDEIREIEKTLKEHPKAGEFDFIRSEKSLFEILPKGSGKGTSIIKLCEYLKVDLNKTYAIGDYNNDISMFYVAKTGIAVSNACDDAKNVADYITVSNEEHAIARVIYDIEQGKF